MGINCGAGPRTVLDIVELVARSVGKPVGIVSGATSDVTVKAGQSIVLNDGTSFGGPFTAILTPTSCD